MSSKQRAASGEGERTILSNWAFARHGRLLVVCSTGSSEPPAADFEVWLERLRQNDFDKLLIHGQGGEPSSRQRAQIADYWRTSGRPVPRTVVLTDSVMTRGVLTAINWLLGNTESKCLPLCDLEPALIWLGHPGSVAEIAASIRGMTAALEMRRTG